MAKARMRRMVSRLLKEHKIPSKLYRGSKLAYFRRSGPYMRFLVERLLLSKPKIVVHDCDGFNHVVKNLVTYQFGRNSKKKSNQYGLTSFQNKLWKRRGYVFVFPQVEFEDGNYSCGCETTPKPQKSRDEIEKQALIWYQQGKPLTEIQIKQRDALLRGEHITDREGVLLKELWKSE